MRWFWKNTEETATDEEKEENRLLLPPSEIGEFLDFFSCFE